MPSTGSTSNIPVPRTRLPVQALELDRRATLLPENARQAVIALGVNWNHGDHQKHHHKH
jgi:hypothetical protein